MEPSAPPELPEVAKPDREATFLRLLVDAPTGEDRHEILLRRAVWHALGLDATGRPWRVGRVFAPIGCEVDPTLTRFFEVTGQVVATPSYPLQKLGFELAYGLAAEGPWRVQPDLPSTAFAMDPGPDGLVEPGRGAVQKGGPHRKGTEDKQWALKNIRCLEAWKVPPAGGAAKGAGIRVAQPDTGFTDHPELGTGALDLTRDWDVLQGDDDAHDPLQRRPWNRFDSPGHGTSTASVVVSREQLTVTGVVPLASVVPVRATRSVVQVSDGDVAKAVDHARLSYCHVISMSLGGVGSYDGLRAAIRRAVQDGLIVCAAAGNHVGFVVAPARFPECIAVAATNIEDRPWEPSSRGPEVDVSAPGESVWVADIRLEESPPRYDVCRHSGTSFAVTHLAGVAALWLAHHGREALIRRYGREHLQAAFMHMVRTVASRKPPNWDSNRYGAGIIDALALLSAMPPKREEVTSAMPPWPGPLEKLHGVVPQLSQEELATRLAGLLRLEHAELPEQLDRFEAELAYLLTEHAELRIRLSASQPDPYLADRLALLASPSLARELATRDRRNPAEGQ